MKEKLSHILAGLFGLMMINGGLNKFLNYMPMPAMEGELATDFGAMMEISWLMPLVAIAELIGGVLLIWPKTRALGAIILVPIVLGILAHHLAVDPAGMPMAGILTAVLAWIIYQNFDKYKSMIGG